MIESVVLSVIGMKCGGCETNVITKLSELAGVGAVTASHKDQQVSVEFDSEKLALEVIKDTITKAGFQVA